jgi:glycosyltransferase involved in cell wall biosynthesis
LITTVGVVVPAADEELVLRDCLRALRASRDDLRARYGSGFAVRVVVVLDACTDGSGRIVAEAHDVETVSISARQVGAARRAGCEHLLRDESRPGEVWLANTDADSRVPRNWLADMVEHADAGADLVLGTVRPARGLSAGLRAAWYDSHVLTDGHPHVHGANFGIRADVYRTLGGWPVLATGEDETLAARAAARPDVRVVRTARSPVSTSTRLIARAPYGFSSYLRGLTA